MARVLFKYGNYASYQAAVKDENTIYFVSDKQQIYKGSTLFGDVTESTVRFANEVPNPNVANEGIIYIVSTGTDVSIYTKSGDEMVCVGGGTVREGTIVSLGAFDDNLLIKSGTELSDSDEVIATSGAVKEAIASAVEGLDDAFTDVAVTRSAENNGTVLKFTTNGGTSKEVTIQDLFLSSADYNTETHILTLKVGESDEPIEVDLSDLVPQAVNASQVALARDITATVAVGNIAKGEKIEVKTITDVQKLFEKMLSKDSDPSTTQPSVSVSLTGAGEKEVGTKVTPSYTVTLNAGSYSANASGAQPTGVTAKTYAVTDTNGGTADTKTGTFDAFTVEDGTSYTVSATVTHTAGNVPTTYLGNEYPAGQIKEGTKSGTSQKISGYRNCWWGYKTSSNLITDPTAITVQEIKDLGNSSKNKPSSLAATGMQQMFFAVPASSATSLSIVGTNAPLPQTVLGPVKINVGGVDNYSPIEYKVFYVSNEGAASGSETYKLTWA